MASERDGFLTTYGWAFMAIRDAREKAEAAPESARLDLRILLDDVERTLHEDLTMLTNRAGTMARRIGVLADSAHTSPEEP